MSTATPLPAKARQTKKVIVAVHGIGDQFKYATIQWVVNQICDYYGKPAAVPLGQFYTINEAPLSLCPPYPEEPFNNIFFAEVYWASIARKVSEEKHTLEEAKKWARTIVERLRLRFEKAKSKFDEMYPAKVQKLDTEIKRLEAEAQALDEQIRTLEDATESGKEEQIEGDARKKQEAERKKTEVGTKKKETAERESNAEKKKHEAEHEATNYYSNLDAIDYDRLRQVLEEMIETIAVLERLCYLAGRAGIFTFDLRKVLDDYLGDVQLVTEFAQKRQEILDEFDRVMKQVYDATPPSFAVTKQSLEKLKAEKVSTDVLERLNEIIDQKAKGREKFIELIKTKIESEPVITAVLRHAEREEVEIYIVAHSEGTVVSFIGLLRAMCRNEVPDWLNTVRGFMTIGSPIDKHLILWPELWREFENNSALPSPQLDQPIVWYNYYDYGDPIGFELGETRRWLEAYKWTAAFRFDEKKDFGFTRYYLPGKAHNDYWTDENVFGHFFKHVVLKKDPDSQSRLRKNNINLDKAPRPRSWAWMTSWIFPYIGVSALLATAIYILYKAILQCTGDVEGPLNMLKQVTGMSSLLLGVTVVVRIPRLTTTKKPLIRLLSLSIFVILANVYWRLICDSQSWERFYISLGVTSLLLAITVLVRIPNWPATKKPLIWLLSMIILGIPVVTCVWLILNRPEAGEGWRRLYISLTAVLIASLVSWFRPDWGVKPLLFVGCLAISLLVGVRLLEARTQSVIGPIWPVVLATAGFLYLWWLATLMFDLVFVWHRYIRLSLALKRLTYFAGIERTTGHPADASQSGAPIGSGSP